MTIASAPAEPSQGPGSRVVGWSGIVALTAYLVALAFILASNLVALWGRSDCAVQPGGQATVHSPSAPETAADAQGSGHAMPTAAREAPSEGGCVSVLGYAVAHGSDARLLLIVVFAGALGGVLHGLRSLFWYVGNRNLRRSWVLMYLLLPWTGAIVALLFYFVLRAGLLTATAPADNANDFGIAAVAGLVGLFSQAAVLKLKTVFDTLFTPPPPGKDAVPQDGQPLRPKVTGILPDPPVSGAIPQSVTVNGADFRPPLRLKLTAPGGSTTVIPDPEIKNTGGASLEVETTIDVAGEWAVVVTNSDGRESEAFKFTAT